ncbi:MAG TPA: mechanosensitive ion channel family protein, partial [Chloroflexota bacterium]|nr:mechanosensitive ion channel family protein [Chloroflexota bacterium]
MNRALRRLAAPLLVFTLLAIVAARQDDLLSRSGTAALAQAQTVISYALQIGIFLSAAYLVNRVVELFLWEGLVQRRVGIPAPRLVRDLATAVVYMVALTSIAAVVFQRPVAGIWTSLGALSVVIGLALRDVILDLFVGISLNVERSFKIGDYIMIQQSNLFGRVEQIYWRTTRLSTNEGNTIIIPNRRLGEMVVTNFSDPGSTAEFELLFSLDYAVPTERALRVLTAGAMTLAGVNGILADPEPKARVKGTSALGVDYKVKYWIDCAKVGPGKARHFVLTSVLDHLRHAGISLAYQKQDLFLSRMPQRQLDDADVTDRLLLLSRIDLFDQLPRPELESLALNMTRHLYKQGSQIIKQDESGDSMFVVFEGLLRASILFPGESKPSDVGQIQPGGFFGEMSLLTGAPRTATISAITDSLVYEVTKRQMEDLFVRGGPDVANTLSRVVAERRLRNDAAYVAATRAEQDQQRAALAEQILISIKGFFG